jgi:hypothetical protein
MTTNTGGPAFPGLHPSKECHYKDSGMTLRDFFAAKAMQAVFTGAIMEGLTMNQDINCDKAAETAYTMADAMLRAREQK